MFYADLSNECDGGAGPFVRAVGWLSKDHPYNVGSVSDEFIATLNQHVEEAWQGAVPAGVHHCELCVDKPVTNGLNLCIPTATELYSSPAMITHYVTAHGYRPPDEFIDAVMQCPRQGTPEFFRLLEPYLRSWGVELSDYIP